MNPSNNIEIIVKYYQKILFLALHNIHFASSINCIISPHIALTPMINTWISWYTYGYLRIIANLPLGLGFLPFCFNVISKVLRRLFRNSTELHAQTNIYVDDIGGITLLDHCESDMQTISDITDSLLGPNSIAKHKSEHGRQLDFIGWYFDLDQWLVMPSKKNFESFVFTLFSFNEEELVDLETLQRISSLNARYKWCFRAALYPASSTHMWLCCRSAAPYPACFNSWARSLTILVPLSYTFVMLICMHYCGLVLSACRLCVLIRVSEWGDISLLEVK